MKEKVALNYRANRKGWFYPAPVFINFSIDPNVCNNASMFRSLNETACILPAINLEKIKDVTNMKIDERVFAGGASKGAL